MARMVRLDGFSEWPPVHTSGLHGSFERSSKTPAIQTDCLDH